MNINVKKIKSQLSEELRKEFRIRMRIKIVTIIVGLSFGIVIFRAFELHCIKNSALGWVANKQYQARFHQSSRRGKILDRNGRDLAVSLPVPSIYTDPRMASLTDDEVARLAGTLGLNKKVLSDKFKSPRKFVWLKRSVERNVLESVRDIQGVYSIEESKRFYPNGELASHILGAVGLESEALAGIELANDGFLSSKRRDTVYRRDARGKFYVSPVAYREQDDVEDVYLTIDKQIQFAAESALKKAAASTGALGGNAIVMDVETGAILAMANMPAFDSNNYSKYSQEFWRNRAVTDTFEPGSIFKALIVAAALEDGAVTPNDVFDCENGAINIGNATLHDHNPYGRLSVRDIIKVSSNIGALKVARKVGKDKLYDYLKKFGIGSKTGVDYPGEVAGIVRDPSTWRSVEFGTIAFGQGISVTPIQMVTAFTSVANGGRLMRPYMVDRIVDNQGITVVSGIPTVTSQPISEATAKEMIRMLEGAVGEGGTGTLAASREYPVAGKTGTAQKVIEGAGHYVSGKYYSSFIGIAPSNNPKIAVFVGLDEPKGAYYGGVVSAPIFKEIAEVTLKYLDVPSSLSKVVVAGQRINTGVVSAERKRFHNIDGENFEVPDVSGISMRDVMMSVGRADIKIKVEGTGLAVNQDPPAGSRMRRGDVFRVSFRQPE